MSRTMIWLVFALSTALVILALARPLLRAPLVPDGAASEIEAYKLQLAELSREEERGTLGHEEAQQTRTEISRRMLKASRKSSVNAIPSVRLNTNIAFFVLAAFIAIGAVGIYAKFGSPGQPDEPLEARLDAPPDQQSIGIQIANVERRLRANPRDGLGWSVIAPVYFRIGQFDKAVNAYQKAIELNGEDEDKLLGLTESLIFANNGVLPDQGKPALKAALALNPKSLRGRYWQAFLADQEGKKPEAEQIYRQMLSENIAPAWQGVIKQRLEALNSEPAASNQAENQQASNDVTQGAQGSMIRGMVERLAARLKENAADLEGWLRLIRSYVVLKEADKAQEAAAAARHQFASDANALDQIDTLARNLGMASPDTKGAQPKS